jgi:hypothetical protein
MFVTKENIGILSRIYPDLANDTSHPSRIFRPGVTVPEPYQGWDWLAQTMYEMWCVDNGLSPTRKVTIEEMRERYPAP